MNKHKLIQDIRGECECEQCEYCPLEVLIHTEPRILEQHKMVEKYKFIISQRENKEVTWDDAYISWVNSGMAKRFSDIYNPELNHNELAGRLGML